MSRVETGESVAGGTWRGRPQGIPSGVPPPSVPLSYLAASSLGLVACGAAWMLSSGSAVVDPTADPVVAAAHLGMLATLSMGVLGALHQFGPVVSQRPLRSIALARLTFVTWLAASWLLPLGIGTQHEWVVEAGGAFAATSVTCVAVNMSHPLAARGRGVTVTGLRLALAGLIVTACFGVTYVADRRGAWFDLSGHIVLAHAVVGLFGWLGLAYVSVAEKLWPMFFLAHVPGPRRAGRIAVWGVAVGVALLSPGLLTGMPWFVLIGASVLVVGLGAHLFSLGAHVVHRKRPPDLHLAFVVTAAAWIIVGVGLAGGSALVIGSHHHSGMALAAASVAAFGAWLFTALVGHAHKVVPFIAWSALRARGVSTEPNGRPLLFSHLYWQSWARITYWTTTAGLVALCQGLAASERIVISMGGAFLMVSGLIVAANLAVIPVRLLSASVPRG